MCSWNKGVTARADVCHEQIPVFLLKLIWSGKEDSDSLFAYNVDNEREHSFSHTKCHRNCNLWVNYKNTIIIIISAILRIAFLSVVIFILQHFTELFSTFMMRLLISHYIIISNSLRWITVCPSKLFHDIIALLILFQLFDGSFSPHICSCNRFQETGQ